MFSTCSEGPMFLSRSCCPVARARNFCPRPVQAWAIGRAWTPSALLNSVECMAETCVQRPVERGWSVPVEGGGCSRQRIRG